MMREYFVKGGLDKEDSLAKATFNPANAKNRQF
jgi:hypothetical protein